MGWEKAFVAHFSIHLPPFAFAGLVAYEGVSRAMLRIISVIAVVVSFQVVFQAINLQSLMSAVHRDQPSFCSIASMLFALPSLCFDWKEHTSKAPELDLASSVRSTLLDAILSTNDASSSSNVPPKS